MKQQIIIIHGGDTFKSHKEYIKFLKEFKIDLEYYKSGKQNWKSTLSKNLGKGYEIIQPAMPNKNNAQYVEWKLWFKKLIPYLNKEIILIGHSLGGTFLAKYLSENNFPKKIKATFLLAAPFGNWDNKKLGYSLASFKLPQNLDKLQKQGGKIFIYQSKDDPVVPFDDCKKYNAKLKNSKLRIFTNKKHFNQERFPELIKDIKNI